MARYEKADHESGKFWEITLKGRVVSTRIGKIGAGASRPRGVPLSLRPTGRTTDRELPDVEAAKREYDRLVAAKIKEGFRLVDSLDAIAATAEVHVNEELEDEIASAPDDDAGYLVYADWLQGLGDPRGELIALQYGMRGQQDPMKFLSFKKREEALRLTHARAWLGEVAADCQHRLKLDWRNGFIRRAQIDGPHNATEASLADVVRALLGAPVCRFVRELVLRGLAEDIAKAMPDYLDGGYETMYGTVPSMPSSVRIVRMLTPTSRDEGRDAALFRNRLVEIRDQLVKFGFEVEIGTYAEERYVPQRE